MNLFLCTFQVPTLYIIPNLIPELRYSNSKDNFPLFALDTFCLQSKQRRKPTFREAQRRAQSEGPGIRNPLFQMVPNETTNRRISKYI